MNPSPYKKFPSTEKVTIACSSVLVSKCCRYISLQPQSLQKCKFSLFLFSFSNSGWKNFNLKFHQDCVSILGSLPTATVSLIHSFICAPSAAFQASAGVSVPPSDPWYRQLIACGVVCLPHLHELLGLVAVCHSTQLLRAWELFLSSAGLTVSPGTPERLSSTNQAGILSSAWGLVWGAACRLTLAEI